MSDLQNVGLGARLLAIEAALRALIDQASQTDPALRYRITDSVDTYLSTIPLRSEIERVFAERQPL